MANENLPAFDWENVGRNRKDYGPSVLMRKGEIDEVTRNMLRHSIKCVFEPDTSENPTLFYDGEPVKFKDGDHDLKILTEEIATWLWRMIR